MKNESITVDIPTTWTKEQAHSVLYFLAKLSDIVWELYEPELLEPPRNKAPRTTSPRRPSEDFPF